MNAPVRILGIDPGLRRTGWGVIDCEGARVSFVACGSVDPDPKLDLGPRLALLHEGLTRLIADFSPDEAAVEETFVNADSRSALKLGAARGVAMLVPAQAGLVIGEYAPNHVKKTVVGAGHAEKQQIRLMVKVLLPKAVISSDDAGDALAIALCHAQNRGMRALKQRLA
ncbi:MAG TPA: crossover junction endodeoxyribonuclease RuvC [Beijerinckiaceae bacterium]|nr:crossover junction endodeoxyribonuclease RuvC [Beijerinckiaceae bacterium]